MAPEDAATQHLYLARHGRTALNAEGRLRGLSNPPLDGVGLAEAAALAADLAPTMPVAVHSSPLDRAVRTAEAVAEAAGVPHRVDERFNDRSYGPWTGEVKAEVVAQWGSVDAAPGVEPIADIVARALPALDAVLDENGGGPVVVVTHDAVIRAVIEAIDPSLTSLAEPTGCWNELARTRGVWRVLSTDRVPPRPAG